MKLSDTKIEEFQRLYFDIFGVALTKNEAISQGLALCGLMQSLTANRYKNENDYKYEEPISTKD